MIILLGLKAENISFSSSINYEANINRTWLDFKALKLKMLVLYIF